MNKVKKILIGLYRLIPHIIILTFIVDMILGDKTSAVIDLLIYLIFKVDDIIKAIEKK